VYLLSNKLNNFSHVATLQFILPTPCFWLGLVAGIDLLREKLVASVDMF
jgi:hypothetical protein